MRIAPLLILACSSPPEPVVFTPISPSVRGPADDLGPNLAPLWWMLGDWTGSDSDGDLHWVAAKGAMYGIKLADDHFETMIIDDGEGPGKPDGVLRLIAIPNGARGVAFGNAKLGDHRVTFTNDSKEFPSSITYERDAGGHLAGAVAGGGREARFVLQPDHRVEAPDIAAADVAFSNATGERGVDGWTDAFDDHGAMWRKTGRIEGKAAIADAMRELLGSGKLVWAPTSSGRRADFGYTVGAATFTGTDPKDHWRSTYVTIWHRQADGSWKVWFDTGRAINE